MKFPKNKPSRSKKLMDSANGQKCVRCDCQDGTVVSCHYAGHKQHSFGKGYGQKGDDMATAWLCEKCHRSFDEYRAVTEGKSVMTEDEKLYLSELFLFYIVKTNIERFKQGILKV